MTIQDAGFIIVGCTAIVGTVTVAEKLSEWILWRKLRKLARQRLAHPETGQ